jgi:hypothetical protein
MMRLGKEGEREATKQHGEIGEGGRERSDWSLVPTGRNRLVLTGW